MVDFKAGQVILKREDFTKELAGGLTGDVILEKGTEDGTFVMHASVVCPKISLVMAQKVRLALDKLTKVTWTIDAKTRTIFHSSFTPENLAKAVKGRGGQMEFKMKIKQTPLGKACNTWMCNKAKQKELKDKSTMLSDRILEEMRKVGRNTITIDNTSFERKVIAQKEQLVVKGS